MEHGSNLKKRRRMISCSYYNDDVTWGRELCDRRAKISGWSPGMSKRLRGFLDNFRDDFEVMVTLTYPKVFPKDGKEVKAHWRALVERMRRKGWFGIQDDGHAPSIVWFLEFQERGAPHLHMLSTDWVSKAWIAIQWANITGGSVDACTRVESLRHPTKAAEYAVKYAMKSEQKEVPPAFVNVGRMWGCVGARADGIGRSRVPVVEASIAVASPDGLEVFVRDKLAKAGVRVYFTLAGWVMYGREEGINEIWRCLTDVGKYVDLYGKTSAGLRRRP